MKDSKDELIEKKKQLIEKMGKFLEKKIEKDISPKFEINYIKTLIPYNKNSLKDDKIIYGQIFIFNFDLNEIEIIDKKEYENHFEKTKKYGPFSFEYLGFSGNIISIMKMLCFVNIKLDFSDDRCLELPKYIIANREKIYPEIKIESKIANLFQLWRVDDKNFKYEDFISLYNTLVNIERSLLKRLSNNDNECSNAINEYNEICNKIRELNRD